MRKWRFRILPALMLLTGLGLLFYPNISNYVNRLHSSKAVQDLKDQVTSMESGLLSQQLQLAREYNAALDRHGFSSRFPEGYDRILDFGNGIMGYISIPSIDVMLPIYHGVGPEALQKGVGHMPQTAFPIGGAGNHCVLTGHTGLPSAKLFTDLSKLEPGDRFCITVGSQTSTYQVDQITIVTPTDIQALLPQDGKDYCTLVTCTPYGINSHRLLVRGCRIDAETH